MTAFPSVSPWHCSKRSCCAGCWTHILQDSRQRLEGEKSSRAFCEKVTLFHFSLESTEGFPPGHWLGWSAVPKSLRQRHCMVLLMEKSASHRVCTSIPASLGQETRRYSVPVSYTGCTSLPAPEVGKRRLLKNTGRCQGALHGIVRQKKVFQNLSSTYPTPLSMPAE